MQQVQASYAVVLSNNQPAPTILTAETLLSIFTMQLVTRWGEWEPARLATPGTVEACVQR